MSDVSEQSKGNYSTRIFQSIFPDPIILPLCKIKNVIYLLECKKCGLQYVGKSWRPFHLRVNEHKSTFKLRNKTVLAQHYHNSSCSDQYYLRIIEIIDKKVTDFKAKLLEREEFWIKTLKTQYPFGLNTADRRMGDHETAWGNFLRYSNQQTRKRGKRKGRSLRKSIETEKYISEIHRAFNLNPRDTLKKLHNDLFTSTRNSVKSLYAAMVNRNSSLIDHFVRDICMFRIQSFKRNNNYNAANQNGQQFDHRPIFKIKYSNQGFDTLNFNKIFKLGQLNRYIPKDLHIESLKPKIYFSYEDPFGLSLFNYKSMAINNHMDIHGNFRPTCFCADFPDFVEPNCGHVVTGNTQISDNHELRYLLESGPKFRVRPANIDWNQNRIVLLEALEALAKRLANRFLKHRQFIIELSNAWKNNVELEIERCSKIKINQESVLRIPYQEIKSLKNKFVITVTDKASQNYSFICKRFYLEKINSILNEDTTYKKCNVSATEIKRQLINNCKSYFGIEVSQDLGIPFIQILPKFHKNPIDFRVIITSNKACTKPISNLVSNALKLIDNNIYKYCDAIYRHTGIQCYWIINSNNPILKCLDGFSKENSAKSISTFDFGQMYTNLHHSDIIKQMRKVISIAFGKFKHIWINQNKATWFEPKNSKTFLKVDKFILLELIEFVISNTYFQFGNDVYKQEVGIPMGTDCAPWLANLTLFAYEFSFMADNMKANNFDICRRLSNCFRYIDDITAINDGELFENIYKSIYPNTLTLKKMNNVNNKADVLDICVHVVNNHFVCKLYDKRVNFSFKCNIFPRMTSNIANSCKYNIFNSQLLRYFNIISNQDDLIDTIKQLINILSHKGYDMNKLRRIGIRFINKNRIKFAHKFSNEEFHYFMKFFIEILF